MIQKQHYIVIILLLFAACRASKLNWSNDLKNKQQNDNTLSKYFINLTYRNRLNLEKMGATQSFNKWDTLFLIDKIHIQSSKLGYSYIWDNHRDRGILYFDTISDEARKTGRFDIPNAFVINYRNINYSDIDTVLKFNAENFDTSNIEKNRMLDGYFVIISRIIKGKKIEYFHFSE